MLVAAVPEDMRRYGRVACDAGEAVLTVLRRRTVPVLVSFPAFPGLENRLVRLLEGACSVDEWVAQLAAAFEAADGAAFVGPLRRGEAIVDDIGMVADSLLGCGLGAASARRLVAPLKAREALSTGRVLAARLRAMTPALSDAEVRRLRRQLAPLRDKLREPYREAVAAAYVGGSRSGPAPDFPDDYAEVMHELAVPGPRRAGFFEGVGWGALTGSWDEKGYDSAWGEAGRGAGSILTGLVLVGDVRDATADAWHHDWLDLGIDAVGLIPVFGDMAKGGRTVWRVGDGWRDAADGAQRLQRSRQMLDTTVRVTRNAAADGPPACSPSNLRQ